MSLMKKLLAIIILSLCFITSSKADDIRDFQIEGMSVGDSLLNFYDKKTIKKHYQNYYKDKKFSTFEIDLNKSETYDGLQVVYKSKDPKYIIHSISGSVDCPYKFSKCEKAWQKILPELDGMFKKNSKRIDKGTTNHEADKSKKSKVTMIVYEFYSKNRVSIEMTNWSKEIGYIDNLRISVDTKEFVEWLFTAY